MQVRRVPIGSINPAPYNPRKDLKPGDPEYEKLKRSIDQWDLVEPLVWNERTGNLVGGHQRLKILKARGDTEVDVSVVNLDENEEKALNVALNKIEGEWEFGALADLLLELDEANYDLALTGFDPDEIERMMNWTPGESGEIEEDEVPELPEEPVTKPGDLWLLGRHRLLCGDSTNPLHVDRLMGGKIANMVFTSPPYAQQRTYEGNMAHDWGQLMQGVFSLLPVAEDAQVFVTLGLVHKDGRVVRYWDPWLDWMESAGWPLFAWYVWDKLNGMPGDWYGRLAPAHEWIFHFARKPVRPRKIVETKHPGERVGMSQRNRDGSLKQFAGAGEPIQPYKIQDSVIRLLPQRPDEDVNEHPAVFPVGLPETFLRSWSPRLVYEPFSGSGSTMMAAEQLGASVCGMEITPAYCDVAIRRWERLTGQKAVREDGTPFEVRPDDSPAAG